MPLSLERGRQQKSKTAGAEGDDCFPEGAPVGITGPQKRREREAKEKSRQERGLSSPLLSPSLPSSALIFYLKVPVKFLKVFERGGEKGRKVPGRRG